MFTSQIHLVIGTPISRLSIRTARQLGKLDGKCRPNLFQSTYTGAAYSTFRNVPRLHRVAVVTGAGKGIGRAVALQLAHDGYDIAVNDIHSMASSVNELCKTVKEEMGRQAVALTGDVSLDVDVRRVVDGAVDVLGSVDVMVANAGIAVYKSILDTTTNDWENVLGVNGRGTFLCYKYAAEQMIKQKRGGRIIGASSLAGKQGLPNSCSYSASKFAVTSLTQTAAQEWAKYGITVNAYAPGPIETDMLRKALKELVPNQTGEIPGIATALGFNGTPEDIGGLVSYLASDRGRFITGQVITIDGGVIFH